MELVAITCPSCDGQLEMDASREFGFCLYCGTKIIIQQSQKEVKGTVKIDRASDIINLLILAEDALEAKNADESIEYVNRVLEIDTENYKAWLCKMKAIALQIEMDQYSKIKLAELSYCGQKVLKYIEQSKAAGLDKFIENIEIKVCVGYAERIQSDLGTIADYFCSQMCWENKMRDESQNAVNILLSAAKSAQEIGRSLPHNEYCVQAVKPVYSTLLRYTEMLGIMGTWRSFKQEVNDLHKYIDPLADIIFQFVQEQEQIEMKRNEDYWNEHAEEKKKLIEEKSGNQDLIIKYKNAIFGEKAKVKKAAELRIAEIDAELNKKR